ncbi:MAG: hypothetical protein U1F77_19490 [Kiritimatiellia bacterium]
MTKKDMKPSAALLEASLNFSRISMEVDLVEGGEDGGGVLHLLEAGGDALPDLRHGHAAHAAGDLRDQLAGARRPGRGGAGAGVFGLLDIRAGDGRPCPIP